MYAKLILYTSSLLVLFFHQNIVSAQWEKANGSWLSGISGFAYKDSVLYVTAGSRLFSSTNMGYNWKLINNTSPNRIKLIGEKLIGGSTKGLFCSSDNGETWNLADNNFDNLPSFCSEQNNNYVFAGTYGRGVWRSSDLGMTWKEINNGLLNTFVSTIAFLDQEIIAGTNGGIFLSRDNGDTWNLIYDHPSILSVVTCGNNIISEIWEQKNIISTDGGTTWNNLEINGKPFSDGYNVFITNGQLAFYRSTDQGLNWSKLITKPTVTPLLKHENVLYGVRNDTETLGFNDEIIISKDNGLTWIPIYSYLHAGFLYSRDLAAYESELYSIKDSRSLHYSNDNGNNWRRIDKPADTVYSVLPLDKMVFLSSEKGLYLSEDKGFTWKYLNNKSRNIHYKNTTLYSYDNDSICISYDAGKSWIIKFLPWKNNSVSPITARSLVVHKDHLFFGGILNEPSAKCLFRSSDNGGTWTDVSADLRFINGLSWYEIGVENLISIDDFLFAFSRWNIFRSSDLGNTWAAVDPVGALDQRGPIAEMIENNGILYCVEDRGGVYYSVDYGDNWKFISIDRSMDIACNSEYLFAVNDEGINRYSLNRLTTIEKSPQTPDNFYLSQNYPNPFNPSTTIRYQVPQASFVSLKVFDILGKEVASLVNEYKSPGEYSIDFNAFNLHSGVYLYQLRAQRFSQTKKFTLLK